MNDTRQLKPLLAVFGGPRMEGPQELETRFRSKEKPKLRKYGSAEGLTRRVHKLHRIHHAEEWRAAKRFLRNGFTMLGHIWIECIFGFHLALQEEEDDLFNAREMLYALEVEHNTANPHWQVITELIWTPLSDEAISTLRTKIADFPERFWIGASVTSESAMATA